jgi:hypothetical protein
MPGGKVVVLAVFWREMESVTATIGRSSREWRAWIATRMCSLAFEPMKRMFAEVVLDDAALDAAIAATAEGYSFPTNLDRDPPARCLAPQMQAALLNAAVTGGDTQAEFDARLKAQAEKKRP